MKGGLIHAAKVVLVRWHRLSLALLPFQTTWFVNRLLAGRHAFLVSRILNVSMDYPARDGCDTWPHAFVSDFSSRRSALRGGRMGFNGGKRAEPWVFLDVTNYWRHDDRTGLHRRICEEVRYLGPASHVIVYDPLVHSYRYANDLLAAKFPTQERREGPVVFSRGDKLVLMQAAVPDGVRLADFSSHGVRIIAIVDDVIPIRHPEMVVSNQGFVHAFRDIILHADLVLSVSKTAVGEIRDVVRREGYPANAGLRYGYFYNGCDFRMAEAGPLSADEQELVHDLAGRPFVLSVGALEARKGYLAGIRAFETLWAQGSGLCHVITGQARATTGDLVERIRSNPAYGKTLFLAKGSSDALLSWLYRHSLFVLNCSYAEGFGIPLMEASFYGRPVLARDLPVFREIMGDEVRYFHGDDPKVLGKAVREAAVAVESGEFRPARRDHIACLTWKESAAMLGREIAACGEGNDAAGSGGTVLSDTGVQLRGDDAARDR